MRELPPAPDSWNVKVVADVVSKMAAGTSVNAFNTPVSNGEPGVLKLSAVVDGRFVPSENKAVKPEEFSRLGPSVRRGTLLISRSNTSELLGACAFIREDYSNLHVPDLLWVIEPTAGNDPLWLQYLFASRPVRRGIHAIATGTSGSMKKISMGAFRKLKVLVPPLPEQKRIAAILSTWDRAIELTERLIAAKQKRKQALMQQVLTGKVRPDSDGRWKRGKLSSVVRRVNDPLTVDPKSLYREIGIRSHGKGIFHKGPVTGKSLGNKRVFRVHPDCFVFNVVFAWEQAISKTTCDEEGMIASHRFPMYQPIKDKIDLDYLLYFFKTSRGKHLLGLASPGGAGRNRTLSQSGFLNTSIQLPPVTEQRRISTILSTTDMEIELLGRRRVNLSLQKRGLLQQLLTGKIRVKVDN